MTRLIDADALAHDLEHDVELCARALDDMNMVGKEREDMQFQKDCKQNCIWYISEQPTVEAVPVRHGKWLPENRTMDAFWVCSCCGFPSEAHGAFKIYKFCPNCGAKMDKE